ncbi:hypothetical protein DMENIID0001_041570 [Sergentomyia squamirostris]
MSLRNTNLCPLDQRSPHWRTKLYSVQKPRVMGAYSKKDNEFINSLNCLRYLRLPEANEIPWNLNIGYEDYQKNFPVGITRRDIDDILKFITMHPDKMKIYGDDRLEKSSKVIFPDFVCQAGLLTELLEIPYRNKNNESDNFLVCNNVMATKYRGTIYLLMTLTCDCCNYGLTGKDENDKLFYYGQRYRHMMTTDNLNKQADFAESVFDGDFFVSFQSRLGRYDIFYTGDINGVQSERNLDEHEDLAEAQVKFIEVHTQNFLTGVETLYSGHRNPEGILEAIEPIAVKEIPKMAASEWKDSVCVKFAIAFLDLVKAEMRDIDDPNTVFKFVYDPTVSDCVQYQILPGKSELSFLPTWYVDFLDELAADGSTVKESSDH